MRSALICNLYRINSAVRLQSWQTSKLSTKMMLLRGSNSDASILTGQVSSIPLQSQKIVGRWLLGCAGMTFGAVIIGGLTRLTESGLSMTKWHILKDMKPPRSKDEWTAEFERYKQFPEYKYLERTLTLEEFKQIFYMEYIHRMWGRAVGLFFALPALYFLKKGWISRSLKPRLAIYGSLLLFQGLLGWYMVKSGLEDRPESVSVPRVSQYRLAAHLSAALVLYVMFLWSGLKLVLQPQTLPNTIKLSLLRSLSHSSMTLIFITAISGAFVSGLDAGLVYNSWPKMAGKWVPDDLLSMTPKWRNMFENATTTQFNHRFLGELTAVSMVGLWLACRRMPLSPRARTAANALVIMALIQASLGVATLLSYVPISLAVTHQAGAMTLLSFSVWLTLELRKVLK